MNKIPLPLGFETLVDADVYLWASVLPLRIYGNPSKPYVGFSVGGARHLLHRVLLQAPLGVLVDHRNGNSLDNRRANLRLANHSQNAANRPGRGRYKGVRWCSSADKWEICVRKGGHRVRRSGFATAAAAADAYDALAFEIHGAFAWLNSDHHGESLTPAPLYFLPRLLPTRGKVYAIWRNQTKAHFFRSPSLPSVAGRVPFGFTPLQTLL